MSTGPSRIPVSTYRLQLRAGFGFREVRALVPYLDSLGVTDLYFSPYLAARPGSPHGYDICDHGRLNEELGTEADHAALCDALGARRMGHILDFVPNHVGIDPAANPRWRDVLENGPSSPDAAFFDIDWNPLKPEMQDKILLPVLGGQYGEVLERGELRLEYESGRLRVRYFEHDLPVNPREIPRVLRVGLDRLESDLGTEDGDYREFLSILTAFQNLPSHTETAPERIEERRREKEVTRERLDRLVGRSPRVREHVEECVRLVNGRVGEPSTFDALHDLLEAQAYRLAYWRTAFHEINYRRFFDLNDLAGVRMQDPAVFEATHELVLRWVREGRVTGLRLDHLDGLFDPSQYLERLRERVGDLYIVAEKILSEGEDLPAAWPIHGTTGYDFLNDLNGLFVDRRSGRALRRVYERFTARTAPFPIVTYVGKKLIMQSSMASELNVLAHALNRLSEENRRTRDFTLDSLREALREIVACFAVYRTYLRGDGSSESDRRTIDVAVERARRRNPSFERSVFDFVRSVLLPEDGYHSPEAQERRLDVAMRLQQYTGPVQAKGVEDTAFYRYATLLSLNEVGGEPSRFGRSPAEVHAANAKRRARWPHAMLATATHDTKRGEDGRARLNVLSELPREWRAAVLRSSRINAPRRTQIESEWAPDRNEEYLYYQALLGVWPPEGDVAAAPDLVPRLQQYLVKAVREVQLHTSWTNVNVRWEKAVTDFVERTLVGASAARFLGVFLPFVRHAARLGMVNSLAQVTLKIASPGVPDFYQGAELWDLSLVDPDNRRPVDFAARERRLAELATLVDSESERGAAVAELLRRWNDGAIKLYVTACGLRLRRRLAEVFLDGDYVSIETDGAPDGHVFAFARTRGRRAVVAIVPRLVASLDRGEGWLPIGPETWGDTRLRLPAALAGSTWRNVFTGEEIRATEACVSVASVLATCPVALLVA